MSAVGNFFPIFKGGNTLPSIIVASLLLWGVHFLILKGVETAAFINSIVTVAKLIPILLVIICMIIAFNFDTFKTGFFGMTSEGVLPFSWASTMSQVKSTMLVTVWVFIGIEGAVIFSSRAKNKKDVGSATVIGLISVLIIYFLLTVLAQGVILQKSSINSQYGTGACNYCRWLGIYTVIRFNYFGTRCMVRMDIACW